MKFNKLSLTFLLGTLSIVAPACSMGSSKTSINVAVNPSDNTVTEPAGTPIAGGGESQSASAEALVADLYKQHDAKKSPFFQTKNRALVDKYFTKALADLIWKDATTSSGEVGAIDGDPLYNAQDMEIKNFAIGKAEVKGETANVPVTFTNYGQKQNLNFSLKRVSGAWRIDDISFGPEDSLMRWLRNTYNADPKTQTSSYGLFEGKYQVGPTTCTVTPVKMGYEVRWAKGSGVEMFYFKEGGKFESDGEEGGTNFFVFDDESYDKGVFHRSDEKNFAVKRIK